MPINYNIIAEVTDVDIRARTGMGMPLVEIVLGYKTKSGKQQEYIYPAKPMDVHLVLDRLLDEKLISEWQCEAARTDVNALEKELISSPYYQN